MSGCGAQLGQELVMAVVISVVLVLVIATIGEAMGQWEFWGAMEFDCTRINAGR